MSNEIKVVKNAHYDMYRLYSEDGEYFIELFKEDAKELLEAGEPVTCWVESDRDSGYFHVVVEDDMLVVIHTHSFPPMYSITDSLMEILLLC